MKNKSLPHYLAFLIILLGLFAQFYIAVFSQIFGIAGGDLALVTRAFVFLCSLSCIALVLFKLRIRHPRFVAIFLLFWILYISRLAWETFHDGFYMHDSYYYWSFALGVSLFPSLALVQANLNKDDVPLRTLFGCIMVFLIISAPFLTAMAFDGQNHQYDTGQFSISKTNPIQFGHLGVTLIILAFAMSQESKSIRVQLLVYVGIILGLASIILSAARGPILSLFFVFLFALLFLKVEKTNYLKNRFSFLGPTIFGFLFVFGVISLITSVDVSELTIVGRTAGTIDLADRSSAVRFLLLLDVLEMVSESPLIGSGIESQKFELYPHNLFLEAIIATGIFGLMLILTLVFVGLLYSVRCLRAGYNIFPSLFFVQQLIAVQFSGAIYSINYFWISLALIVTPGSQLNRCRP